MKTPYGYVGSSGGGAGGYSVVNGQRITVYAGKGGTGAGNGGELKKDGEDAQNYGCGGGAAGFGGYPFETYAQVTHCGKGMGGCIIFEILDGGACEGIACKPNDNSGCSCGCGCSHHEFECPEGSNSTSHSETEDTYSLKYVDGKPVETTTSKSVPCTVTSDNSSNSQNSDISGSAADCGCKSSRGNSGDGVNSSTQGSSGAGNSSGCGCGSGSGNSSSGSSCGCGSGNDRCVNYDVEKWGENWLLFTKSGKYSLDVDEDITLSAYVVGGGLDGKDGIYFNKTAYGGNGGNGGYVSVYFDIKVPKGNMDIYVNIASRGNNMGTSVVINNNEYSCNGVNSILNEGGEQGVSGKHGFRHAGNGANGIDTPFGVVGSSGGGGAAYCNSQTTSRGRGGLYGGNGGKIENGHSTPGDKATGYGCGGGGGAASPNSYCSGGKGKQGCVILNW